MTKPTAAVALGWALVVGLLVFVPALAIVWSYRSATARRMRWPLVGLFLLYLIAVWTLLQTAGRSPWQTWVDLN